MTTIVVTGGRNFADYAFVQKTLDQNKDPQPLIHGGASGADGLCAQWAKNQNVPINHFQPIGGYMVVAQDPNATSK